jgi:hypothetical protein
MLLALFAVLSSLSAHASSPPPAVRLALWSEFVPYQQVESYLPQLAAEGISLNVAFHFDQPDFDGFAQLYKQAAKNRVEVRPWLLLRKDDGYWFNSHNIKLGRDSVQEFITEMGGRGVKPNWIIFDVEPPKIGSIDLLVPCSTDGLICQRCFDGPGTILKNQKKQTRPKRP